MVQKTKNIKQATVLWVETLACVHLFVCFSFFCSLLDAVFLTETEGFKIDTMGTYHGMTLKSVTVRLPELFFLLLSFVCHCTTFVCFCLFFEWL